MDEAHEAGFDVLLDAASFVPTHPLDLRACAADFVALSFYKMFGYPTGVGALIARRDALGRLSRPWFAGGTVEFVSVEHDRHGFKHGHEAFEDGTPNFLGIGAVPAGLAFLRAVGMDAIAGRVRGLTELLVLSLQSLRHSNGTPLVTVHGPRDCRARGGTVAFNIVDVTGEAIPYGLVESDLSEHGIYVRGGCFCNPGASEAAFAFEPGATARCLASLETSFSVERFSECLGPGAIVGAVRASVGLPTTERDIARLATAVSEFRDRSWRRRAANGFTVRVMKKSASQPRAGAPAGGRANKAANDRATKSGRLKIPTPAPKEPEGATDEAVGDRTGPGAGYDDEPEQVKDKGGVS